MRAGARASSWLDWVRARTTTTPGRLVSLSILVVAGAVCFGVLATVAERSRAQAARAVRTQTEPLLVQAVTLYTALSDANATATTTFLNGGLEPSARRRRYLADLRTASDSLATLTGEVGTSPRAASAIRTIIEQLPLYAGLVESARINNAQGHPVGAAYLRQASTLLTGTILPAADHLYTAEAKRLTDNYQTGTGVAALVVLALVVLLALGLLIWTQIYLTQISQRTLNVPMLATTVLVTAAAIWALVGLLGERNALAAARRDSDGVEVLSAARVLVSRAQSDESLTLVNRGSDETDPLDFSLVMRTLGSHAGLLEEATALARRVGNGSSANQLEPAFAAYRADAGQTTGLENAGLILAATQRASSPASIAIADRLTGDLTGQIRTAQGRFATSAADATSWLSGLSIAIPVIVVLAAALALVGLRQRLKDYQ